MLKVKLIRTGKKNQTHYRIVVNEARDKRDGKYVENLGHYAPAQIPKILEINTDRFDYWISQGAQATKTVAALVEKFKSGTPFPPKKNKKVNKKARARLEAEKAAKAETAVKIPVEKSKPEENKEANTKTEEEKPKAKAETPVLKTE